MRVLITGGTGYLGRAIVGAVAARGHEPVVFARGARAAGLLGAAIDGDVRDRDAIARAARGCDVVCHTAALVSLWRRDPRDFEAVNVGGLEHVIAAAQAAGARIVYTSSFLALPPHGRSAPLAANDYQRTKAMALAVARRARAAGVPLVTLFPGVLYGPGVLTEGNLVGRLLSDHAAGRLPGLVGADRIWSFAWIGDVAAAHAAAIDRDPPGAEYALGGENAPQRRAFELAASMGLPAPPRRLPYWAASAAGVAEEWRATLTGRAPLVTRGAVEIFRHDWPLESGPARTDLAYATTPLGDGIRTVVDEIVRPANLTT